MRLEEKDIEKYFPGLVDKIHVLHGDFEDLSDDLHLHTSVVSDSSLYFGLYLEMTKQLHNTKHKSIGYKVKKDIDLGVKGYRGWRLRVMNDLTTGLVYKLKGRKLYIIQKVEFNRDFKIVLESGI